MMGVPKKRATRDLVGLMKDQEQHPENYPENSPSGPPIKGLGGYVNSAYWAHWTDERLGRWRDERDARARASETDR